MLIADLRHHLTTDFVVFHELGALCGQNLQANSLISSLFWWTQVSEQKSPEKHGWIYKTAKHLKEELGLTRRGYEKARKLLLDLGIIQYKRAGVFGTMHWQINKQKILELAYRVRGEELPADSPSHYWFDIHNFRLEKWVPIDLWNAFIKMRAEKKNKVPTIEQKKAYLRQLKEMRRKKIDIRAVMEKSIAGGWAGFFPPVGTQAVPQQDQAREEQRIKEELQQQQAEREKPPPDKSPPDSEARQQALRNSGVRKQ